MNGGNQSLFHPEGGISEFDFLCASEGSWYGAGTYKVMLAVPDVRVACSSTPCTAQQNIDWALAPNTQYKRWEDDTVIGSTNAAGIIATFSASWGNTGSILWTGMNANWTAASQHCSAWTANSEESTGAAGHDSDADLAHIMFNNAPNCATGPNTAVLCVEQ